MTDTEKTFDGDFDALWRRLTREAEFKAARSMLRLEFGVLSVLVVALAAAGLYGLLTGKPEVIPATVLTLVVITLGTMHRNYQCGLWIAGETHLNGK